MTWLVWALVGCKSPCEKVTDYLVDECKIVTAADDTVEECKGGSIEACEAECALASDCSIFVPPTSMTSDQFTAFLAAQEVYDQCLKACQPQDTDTEPEDTALF